MKNTGFLLFRMSMGVNMLFHAINRFYYGTSGFKGWMIKEFEPTFLPSALVGAFATILPILEGLVGISLLLGIKTKWGLVVGASIIISLIAGSCLINQWEWVGLQMVYAICFYLLFENMDKNFYALDTKFSTK